MTRILIVHGLGMDQRGKAQVEIFGPMTLPEYDRHIRDYAGELGLEVDIFQSNDPAAVIARFAGAKAAGAQAVLFNPSGYSRDHEAVAAAAGSCGLPLIEVHISNPLRRGPPSDSIKVSTGAVAGFGVYGYYLALRGAKDLLARS